MRVLYNIISETILQNIFIIEFLVKVPFAEMVKETHQGPSFSCDLNRAMRLLQVAGGARRSERELLPSNPHEGSVLPQPQVF